MKKIPLKCALLSAVSMAVICSSAAFAQDANKAKAEETVVVTGSRIVSRGFTQPTPTQSLDIQDIAKQAQPNIFNAVMELPSLQGSSGRSQNVSSTSSGVQGSSSLSLRGLGVVRTLTLIDGQRVVPANVAGWADVSQFPQLLIKRVDVVTGGASASYGSDAVGGVVNFITDTKFEGFKANIQGGQTTYGDDKNFLVQVAWGKNLLNDKLHIQTSAEYGDEGGVKGNPVGEMGGAHGRTWYQSAALLNRGIAATVDGKPQYLRAYNTQNYQYSQYGLITNGPLQGTAFDINGTPYKFNYGSNGVPTGTGAVTNCYSPFCIGGEQNGNVGIGTSLSSKLERSVLYGRVGYDINENHHVYFSVSAAEVNSENTPNSGAAKNGNLTIQCENPFVPASIKALCVTNNITSFAFGTSNAIFTESIKVRPSRRQNRYVAGAEGKFDLFNTKVSYNTYYQHGINHTDLIVANMSNNSRYNKAIDAIDLNGQIVCRDPVARAAGCVALNIIGGKPSQAALNYVMPANGPFQRTRNAEDVFSINFNAEPFSLWAGPVAVATGFEYRKEEYVVRGDPYGNGTTVAGSVNSPAYPVDPTQNTIQGNNWYAGNYHNGQGKYDVKEAYIEFNIPVLDSETLGTANINIADRETEYSTAGRANTWKIGGTWKTKIDGLRFRAVTSKDVRAPNLSELFGAETVFNNVANYQNTTITIQERVGGNPTLKPEEARSSEFGIVLNNPSWFKGFSASADFYKIKMTDVIGGGFSAQQIVDFCVAGQQNYCALTSLSTTNQATNYVLRGAINIAKLETSGVDLEAAYRTNLTKFSLPGTVTLRALATYTDTFKSDPGTPGAVISEAAGANTGSVPTWKGLMIQSYDTEKLSLNITERWISDGVLSNEYIECTTGCPLSTAAYPTIDNNQMDGAFYVDIGGSYKANKNTTVYFKVDNLFDVAPVPPAFTNVNYGANPALYDVLGRSYRAGIRLSF